MGEEAIMATCEQHESLMREVMETHECVREIKNALIGDFEGREGLIHQIAKNTEARKAITGTLWKTLVGSFAGGGVVFGVIKTIGAFIP